MQLGLDFLFLFQCGFLYVFLAELNSLGQWKQCSYSFYNSIGTTCSLVWHFCSTYIHWCLLWFQEKGKIFFWLVTCLYKCNILFNNLNSLSLFEELCVHSCTIIYSSIFFSMFKKLQSIFDFWFSWNYENLNWSLYN